MTELETHRVEVDLHPDQPYPPVSGAMVALTERRARYEAELTPERLMKRHWWQDEELMRRTAWTIGIMTAVYVVFMAGLLVGWGTR